MTNGVEDYNHDLQNHLQTLAALRPNIRYKGSYIAFYDTDKNKLQSINVYNWVTGTNGKATLECTEDGSSNLTSFKVKTLANATYPLTGLAYCRISALGITDSTVITVNQEWDGSSATVNP